MMSMQDDAAAENRRIALEAPLPEAVAEHRVHGCCSFIVSSEDAAERGMHVERREELRRDQVDAHPFRGGAVAESHVRFAMTKHLRQRGGSRGYWTPAVRRQC